MDNLPESQATGSPPSPLDPEKKEPAAEESHTHVEGTEPSDPTVPLEATELGLGEDVQPPPEAVDETVLAQYTSLWYTAQVSRVTQRDRTRYVQDSFAHPGKMLPDLARSLLETYGRPGDRWCDPMCGIGTLLVEGVDRGLSMFGVEWEPRWVQVCQENLALALQRGAQGIGTIEQGDSRHLTDHFEGTLFHRICFSPPYGNTLSKRAHGPDLHPEKQKGGKRGARAIRHGYGFTGVEHTAVPDGPGDMAVHGDELNIGELKHGDISVALEVASSLAQGLPIGENVKPTFLTEMARIYHQCFQKLEPEGLLILVLRDYRRNNRRVDLLGDTVSLCRALGFGYYDRFAAMQCPVISEENSLRVKPEGSSAFWTLYNARNSNPPWMVPVFEDVVVFIKE